MKAHNNFLLAKPFPSDEISLGGIVVPESCRAVSNKMLVVSVGNGTKQLPMEFREGQIVYRIKDKGEEIYIKGEKHFLIHQSYILAKA